MPKHQRPKDDFRITSLAWELDIVDRFTKGGFDPLPRELVVRRFFDFIDFLQQHGLTTRTVVAGEAQVTEASELRNSDLTEEGFEFARLYHGKWLDRLYKDTGREKEKQYLEKWFAKVKQC